MNSDKVTAETASSFMRFVNLLHAIRQLPTFPTLDPVEERLLHELAALWHEGKRVTVLHAMELGAAGSSSTVHRRLKGLRRKGLIDLVPDDVDGRVRYVVATAESARYFQQLGRFMHEAVCKPAS